MITIVLFVLRFFNLTLKQLSKWNIKVYANIYLQRFSVQKDLAKHVQEAHPAKNGMENNSNEINEEIYNDRKHKIYPIENKCAICEKVCMYVICIIAYTRIEYRIHIHIYGDHPFCFVQNRTVF